MERNKFMRIAYRKGERPDKTKSRAFNERMRQEGIRLIEEAVMVCKPEYREEVKKELLKRRNLI